MAEGAVVYRFTSIGADEVKRNFDSIAGAAQRSGNATERGTAAMRKRAGASNQAARAARQEEMAQAKVGRAAEQAANKEQRAKARALTYVARIRDRHFMEQQRQEERAERQAIASQRRIAKARERSIGRMRGELLSRGLGAAGVGGAVAAGIVGASARKAMRLDEMARKIAIQGRDAGGAMGDHKALAQGFRRTSAETGGVISSEDVARGVAAFITKTGDGGMANELQGTFATTAAATGTDVAALGSAAGDLFQKFDIKSVKDMQQAFADLTFQGKKGAFELEDAAAQFPKMASAAKRFGLESGTEGLKELGALSQIARSSVGSGEDAATAMENMYRQLIEKSGVIKKKAGVDVFADKSKTTTKNIMELLPQIIAGTKGDKTKLQEIFGTRGSRGVSGLSELAVQAFAGEGTEEEKTARALNLMRGKLEEMKETGASWSDVQKDAAFAAEASGAKLNAMWESLSAKVGSEVVPHLETLASSLQGSSSALDALAGTAGVLMEMFVGMVGFANKILGTDPTAGPDGKLKAANSNAEAFLASKGLSADTMSDPFFRPEAVLGENDAAKFNALKADVDRARGAVDARDTESMRRQKGLASDAENQAALDAAQTKFSHLEAGGIGALAGAPLAGAIFARDNDKERTIKDEIRQGEAAKVELETGEFGPAVQKIAAAAEVFKSAAQDAARGNALGGAGKL